MENDFPTEIMNDKTQITIEMIILTSIVLLIIFNTTTSSVASDENLIVSTNSFRLQRLNFKYDINGSFMTDVKWWW